MACYWYQKYPSTVTMPWLFKFHKRTFPSFRNNLVHRIFITNCVQSFRSGYYTSTLFTIYFYLTFLPPSFSPPLSSNYNYYDSLFRFLLLSLFLFTWNWILSCIYPYFGCFHRSVNEAINQDVPPIHYVARITSNYFKHC